MSLPKNEVQDLQAWFNDLAEEQQMHILTIPTIVYEILPKFIRKWSVDDLCDIINVL